MSTTPVSVAASAWTGVTVRISRLRARLITAESTATQLSRSLMIGLVVRASSSISSSLSSSPCNESCHSKPNSACGPKRPSCRGSSRVPAGERRPELDPLGDLAVEVLRPHDRMARLGQRRGAAVEEREDLVGVEGDLVGDPQVEQPVEDRPGVGRGAQRDGGVGAGPLAEAVGGLRTGLGPQLGGVGEVGGVVDGVDLQHQAYVAGDQLLLVGLDAERDGHQVRPVVASARPDAGDPLLQLVAERVGAARLRRRGATGVGPRWRERPGVVRGIVSTTASSRPRTMPSAVASSKPSQARERASSAMRRSSAASSPATCQCRPSGSGAKRPEATSWRPISAAPASSATEGCTSVWSRTLPSTGNAPRIGITMVRRSSVNSTEPSRGGSPTSNLAGPVTGTKLMHVLASLRARMRHESHGAE